MKILAYFGLALSYLFLSACASSGTVTPYGENRYIIANRSATIYASGSEMKAELLGKASEFCTTKKLEMSVISESQLEPIPFVRGASSELRFECLPKK